MKTAIEIRDAIRDGGMTAEDAVKASLKIIEEKNEGLNAFLEVYEDEALARARDLDARKAAGEDIGRLGGVPVAVKDVMLVKGHIASAGSKILENYMASYTATAVQRLIDEGAIVIGRTNCDEFAMGASNENSAYGPVKNPYDETRISGGSSGGSAAAVASGMVSIALGSDTGGSIRQPAGFCNLVGLKPSYGRVSRYGLMALTSSFDQIGPFAHTVADAALVLEIMEGVDAHDATSREIGETSVAELLDTSFDGMTFGVPKQCFIEGIDEKTLKLVKDAIVLVESKGGTIKEVDLPLSAKGVATYYILLPAEASSNLARFDGIRYGDRSEEEDAIANYLRTRGDGFGDEVKRRVILGTYILSAGYYDAYYKKALAVRKAMHDEYAEVFKEVDVLITPTSPSPAWKLGEKVDDPLFNYLADIFTCSANIAGICGVSVPCGFSDGLPVGVQFLAGAFEEAKLLRAAAAYEEARGDLEVS